MQDIAPWGVSEVRGGFCGRGLVNIYGVDNNTTRNTIPGYHSLILGHHTVIPDLIGDPQYSLSRHQGYCTRACTYIQKVAVFRKNGHEDTEQDAVGVDLHGTALVDDAELLETEYICRFLHSLRSVGMTVLIKKFTQTDRQPCTVTCRTSLPGRDHESRLRWSARIFHAGGRTDCADLPWSSCRDCRMVRQRTVLRGC